MKIPEEVLALREASLHQVLGLHNDPAVLQLAAVPFLAGDGFDFITALFKHRQLSHGGDATFALEQVVECVSRHVARNRCPLTSHHHELDAPNAGSR